MYLLLLAPVFSIADEMPKNRYILGLKTVDFKYEEPGLMSDRGQLNGLAFIFQRSLHSESYIKAATEYIEGSTIYNGALQTNFGVTTPYSSTEKFRIINFEFMMGRTPLDSFWATYFGIGYRNTFDSKSGQYDYRRDITYYYYFAGLNPVIYSNPHMKASVNFEMSALLGGGAKTYLSDVSTTYQDVNFEFQNGYAFKIGTEIILFASEETEIFTDLSYKHWLLSDSKVEYIGNGSYGVEPHNATALLSFTLGYIF